MQQKKLCISLATALSVFCLLVGFAVADTYGSFGYTTIGGAGAGVGSGYCFGSVFTLSEACQTSMIHAALNGSGVSDTVRLAIYNHTDLSLVGVTSSYTLTNLTTTFAWYQFPLVLNLSTGDYVLDVFASGAVTELNCAFDNAGVGATEGHYQSGLTFPNYPNPLVPTHVQRRLSLYVNYTVFAPETTPTPTPTPTPTATLTVDERITEASNNGVAFGLLGGTLALTGFIGIYMSQVTQRRKRRR